MSRLDRENFLPQSDSSNGSWGNQGGLILKPAWSRLIIFLDSVGQNPARTSLGKMEFHPSQEEYCRQRVTLNASYRIAEKSAVFVGCLLDFSLHGSVILLEFHKNCLIVARKYDYIFLNLY